MGSVRLLDRAGKEVLVTHAPDIRERDLFRLHHRTVHHGEPVPGEVGVHVVEIAVAAVNPFGVIPALAEYAPDTAQVVVALQPHDGHPRQRRTRQRERFDAPDGTGARRIDMAEIERLGSQLFQFRSQFLPIVAEFAEEFRAHALHEHNDHIRPDFLFMRRHLIGQRRGIAHPAGIRGHQGGQRRHGIRIGARQIKIVIGKFVGKERVEQAVQPILRQLGKVPIAGIFGYIHEVDHIERACAQDEQCCAGKTHEKPRRGANRGKPTPGQQRNDSRRHSDPAQKQGHRVGLPDVSDHFIRVDEIIHGHEIETGSEFVPEQQFRDFLKQVPRREQKEKEDGKPPVPPSAVPLPRQEQQVRQHGQD